MDALTAAASTAAAVSTIGSHFMLDSNTYKRGAELGFQGLDFYVTAAVRPACAPVFAGWRAIAVPAEPKAAAVRHLNALHEATKG